MSCRHYIEIDFQTSRHSRHMDGHVISRQYKAAVSFEEREESFLAQV